MASNSKPHKSYHQMENLDSKWFIIAASITAWHWSQTSMRKYEKDVSKHFCHWFTVSPKCQKVSCERKKTNTDFVFSMKLFSEYLSEYATQWVLSILDDAAAEAALNIAFQDSAASVGKIGYTTEIKVWHRLVNWTHSQ